MKIDRVILSSNNNPLYYQFWNPLSKIYAENFGIKPTLIWFGSVNELNELSISKEFGDIVIVKAVDKYPLPFQTTWGAFYHTSLFPNDVCLTMGIDQVPLSGMFLKDMIADIGESDYVMEIADAYLPEHWTINGSSSPSAYHIAKGFIFNKVYGFESTFEKEIEKVCNSGMKAVWEDTQLMWGLDETYSSQKLRQYRDCGGSIVSMSNFNLLKRTRIECERDKEPQFDEQNLKIGLYSEAHLCRPLENHKNYITKMFNLISKYE